MNKLSDIINKILGFFNSTAEWNIPASGDVTKVGATPTPSNIWPSVAPTKAPTATPSPTPMPNKLTEVENRIRRGLTKWNNGAPPPIATMSSQLAKAGQTMPDQYMPAIISILESRGLQDFIPQRKANPYNIFYPGTHNPVDYNGSPENSILWDGNPKNTLNFQGLLREGGPYQDYRTSGDLRDFFAKYSPSNDNNADESEQVRRYNKLRAFFE